MLRRIWAITQKEFIQFIRNRMVFFGLMLAAPLEIILFGVAIRTDVQHIPMVVNDQSLSAASRAYVRAFSDSTAFDVVVNAASQAEVIRAIDAGQASLGLVIPPDFAGRLAQGGANVLLVVDGSSSFTSQAAYRSADAISQQYAVSLVPRPVSSPLNASIRILYNPDLKDLLFIVPGMVGFLMYGISLKLTAFAIVREREIGTIEAILVTPIRPIELMLAKLIPTLCIAFVNMASALAAGLWAFKLPFRGSLFLYLALATLFSFAGLGLGLAVSSISQTQLQANQVASLLNMLAIFLSGFMFPAYSLPWVLRLLSYLLPLTYFVPITNGIFVKGVGLEALWPQTLALIVMIGVILFLGARLFRQRLD
jgi:ABC-2 type transport system permease protein